MENIEQWLKDLTAKFEDITKEDRGHSGRDHQDGKEDKGEKKQLDPSSRRYRKNPGAEATPARQRRKGRTSKLEKSRICGRVAI